MWHYLDVILITLVVACSAAYAVYALGSIKLKRIALTWLVRVFGVRVFTFFSPRLGGCSACLGADARADLLKKLTANK
jgi:hypothetical protein